MEMGEGRMRGLIAISCCTCMQQLMAASALIICCVGLLVFFVRDLNCASIYVDVHAC